MSVTLFISQHISLNISHRNALCVNVQVGINQADRAGLEKAQDGRKFVVKVSKPRHAWTLLYFTHI